MNTNKEKIITILYAMYSCCNVFASNSMYELILNTSPNQTVEIVDDQTVQQTILIDKPITLRTSKRITIERGENFKDQIFHILPGGSLSMEGQFILKGKSYTDELSFILCEGKLSLDKVEMVENCEDCYTLVAGSVAGLNYESDILGGAIYNSRSGMCNLKNCLIDFCGSVYGGGIYNEGELHLENVNFSRNRSVYEGSAVYNAGKLSASECVFQENLAHVQGNAVFNSKVSEVILIKSKFVNNRTLGSDNPRLAAGGAICTLGVANATDCLFEKNNAANGGAIFIAPSGKMSFTRCKLLNNYATHLFFGLYPQKYTEGVKPYVFLENDNVGIYRGAELGIFLGGGIYVASQGTLEIDEESQVVGNSAHIGGGVFLENGANVKIESLKLLVQRNVASEEEVADIAISPVVLKKQYMLAMTCSDPDNPRPNQVHPVDINGNPNPKEDRRK